MDNIGNAIRAFRRYVGITQEQFCTQAGVQRSYIAKVEANRAGAIRTSSIERFARAYGVSAGAFWSCLEVLEAVVAKHGLPAKAPVRRKR